MKLIVCLDEREGMSFGGKRQSRDRILIEDMKKMLDGEPLFITEYSEKLLFQSGISVKVCHDLHACNGFCFVENESVSDYGKMLEELVIYRWNRHYPSDLYFDLAPAELGLRLESIEEFEGSSHEKITKERYKK